MKEFDVLLGKASAVIGSIAQRNRCSEEEVRKEMDAAIQAGYEDSDPEVRAMWDSSPFANRKPTPEEFLIFCTAMMADYEESQINGGDAEL